MAVESEIYDAIVIGSGAAGGWAAKELCERGCKTLLLEAGRALDTKKDFTPPAEGGVSKIQLMSRATAVLTGQQIQARCMSFSPLTKHLFVSDRENPYTTPKGAPFNWYRGRQVGGRLHLWGRNALRIADSELHAAEHDGFGESWPLSYTELAPWYEKVEMFLGVHGSAAGIPSIPDGVYDRPHHLTQIEKKLLDDLKVKWAGRPATTCRIVKHNPERLPLPIIAAQKTGKLTLRSDAVASHLTIDKNTGKADGVVFFDRETKKEHRVRGRAVVVCASTIESLRILLNSKSSQHPNGLGGSSGNLGRYLTDHVMIFQAGPHHPLEPGAKNDPYDFGAQSGIYIPSFRNTGSDKQKDFLRGYSLLGSVGRIEPGWFFMAVGEMLPRRENFVELDKSEKDAWGIPAAKIACVHSDNEKAMVRDMSEQLAQLAQDLGLQVDHLQRENVLSRTVYQLARSLVYTKEGALVPGSAIHETGGAAMGADQKTSVLNKHNQCWDAPNVFVTDSASFTTAPFQNPGLTIMALSARAGNFIADEMAKGNL
ncbi:MAG TPA: GMC family oxidoreductase [Polyangiales bacterium]|nr:GMC family oxidoreductase [Polyangiales bacterium]